MEHILAFETGWRPGVIGRMIEMQARYYAGTWGLESGFEAQLAQELGAFLARYRPDRDFLLAAMEGDRVFGSVVIDSAGPGALQSGAELRWFIVDSPGRGIGRSMLSMAMEHVDRACFSSCSLSTFQRAAEADRLYEEFGFRFVVERDTEIFGIPLLRRSYVRMRQ